MFNVIAKAHLKFHRKFDRIEEKKAFFQKLLCSVCGRKFKTVSALLNHSKFHKTERAKLLLKTPSESRQCNVCLKVFNSASTQKIHQRSHVDLPFACSVCSKRFPSFSGLRVHSRIQHSEYMSHVCVNCGETFQLHHVLLEHIKKKHFIERQKFACQYCDKVFEQESALQKHSVIHIKNVLYICTQCNKPFQNKQNLMTHMSIHS